MKVIINEAQFKKLLEFDDESDQEHADYYRETGFYGKVGSGCIILARNTGRILLPKRSGVVLEPHTWGTWGGAIDIGEDPAYSARREVYEEAGYKGDMELYPLCVYEKGDVFKYYSYLAVVNNEFRPQLNWETDRADWFDLIDLPSPLHFGLKYILNNRNAVNTINKFINIDESISLNLKNSIKNIVVEENDELNELLTAPGGNSGKLDGYYFALYKGILYTFSSFNGEEYTNQIMNFIKKLKIDGVYDYSGPYPDMAETYFDRLVNFPQVISGYFETDGTDLIAHFYTKEFLDVRISDEVKKMAKDFKQIQFFSFEGEDKAYSRDNILNSSDKVYNTEVKLPKYVYHGTSVKNVPGILRKGLRADPNKTNFAVKHTKYVFLTSVFANAEFYADMASKGKDINAILKINTSKIDINKINFDYDFYHDYVGQGNEYYNKMKQPWDQENYLLRNKSNINPGAKYAKFGYDGIIYPEAVASIYINDDRSGWREIFKDKFMYPKKENKSIEDEIRNLVIEEIQKLNEESFHNLDTRSIINNTINEYFKSEKDEIDRFIELYQYSIHNDDNEGNDSKLVIADDEIRKSTEFREFVYEELNQNLCDAMYGIEGKIHNGKITIYRMMNVNQEWLENLSYSGKHLGVYWTWEKGSADAYWGKNLPFTIIISAEVPEQYINWDETLYANISPSYSVEQEIRLFKNTPIQIKSIEQVKGRYYLPITFIDLEEIQNKTFLA